MLEVNSLVIDVIRVELSEVTQLSDLVSILTEWFTIADTEIKEAFIKVAVILSDSRFHVFFKHIGII